MFVMKVSVPSQTTAADRTSRLKEAVDSSPAVSYILDSELHIQHCNPAWDKFARENGAPHLNARDIVGRALLEFIPDVLRPAYSAAFSQVLTTGNVWEKCYECSSPDLYRLFRMRIHLLRPENWYLVTNSLVIEEPHERAAGAAPHIYLDAHSRVTLCVHCRCSKRLDTPNVWDFVPEYLGFGFASPVKVSDGLCPVCRAYFYAST
jgi:hypothetical protein